MVVWTTRRERERQVSRTLRKFGRGSDRDRSRSCAPRIHRHRRCPGRRRLRRGWHRGGGEQHEHRWAHRVAAPVVAQVIAPTPRRCLSPSQESCNSNIEHGGRRVQRDRRGARRDVGHARGGRRWRTLASPAEHPLGPGRPWHGAGPHGPGPFAFAGPRHLPRVGRAVTLTIWHSPPSSANHVERTAEEANR